MAHLLVDPRIATIPRCSVVPFGPAAGAPTSPPAPITRAARQSAALASSVVLVHVPAECLEHELTAIADNCKAQA